MPPKLGLPVGRSIGTLSTPSHVGPFEFHLAVTDPCETSRSPMLRPYASSTSTSRKQICVCSTPLVQFVQQSSIDSVGNLPRRERRKFDEMAALTVGCSSTAVVGLSGSSITGKKLAIKSARPVPMKGARSVGVATAKYDADKSTYFDLGDIGNTTGEWDLYGSDGLSPYNGLQSKFFETFGGAFTKRGLLLKFLILGGAGALGYASTTAGGQILAIKNGPQQVPTPGPRGRL